MRRVKAGQEEGTKVEAGILVQAELISKMAFLFPRLTHCCQQAHSVSQPQQLVGSEKSKPFCQFWKTRSAKCENPFQCIC